MKKLPTIRRQVVEQRRNAKTVKIRIVLDSSETSKFFNTDQMKKSVKKDIALFESLGAIGFLGTARAK